MAAKHLWYLLLLIVACGSVLGQNEDEIPVENDNQFPPDNHLQEDTDVIEGSGSGTLEEPTNVDSESTPPPIIEDVESRVVELNAVAPTSEDVQPCPSPCVCHVEGDSNDLNVDCSGYGLTDLPSPLDPKTTALNLRNNKLSEIPKDISSLKNLKVLNVDNNSLMDLAAGSISELPELVTLKLANNRLIEYPKDLKNSFGLTKLEELDISGNDMRTELTSDVFTNFISLRKLTLPSSITDLKENLCESLKNNLETVCVGSCDSDSFECPDAPQNIEDESLDATLPGTIAFSANDADPMINPSTNEINELPNASTEETPQEESAPVNDELDNNANIATRMSAAVLSSENAVPTNEYSLRSEVNKESEGTAQTNVADTPKEVSSHNESDVKIGATTVDSKTGGVSKSVIGIIVAGMIVVVAGITIKKNWSSIKKRFSSSPARAGNDRIGNGNHTAPEEVPLQDKSPV